MNASGPSNDDDSPQAKIETTPRRRVNLIWALPALAIVVGAWLGIQAIVSQGPTITLSFKTAEGLEAGKTKLKYKNVEIGTVDSIGIAENDNSIVVKASIVRQAKRLLVEDTRFWIVRPRFAGGQVSGLSTVLSGAFIGVDVGRSHDQRREYQGLETQPTVMQDDRGREIILRAQDSHSLDVGSPVFNRRIQVGEVTAVELDSNGKGVTVHAFIRAPHDRQVTRMTRFWQASGIDVSVGNEGLKVSTQSLVSILLGGIAFGQPNPDAVEDPAAADAIFKLFDDEKSAMKRSEDQLAKYLAFFDNSIEGLSVGAQVNFRGLPVGEVRSVDVEFDSRTREFRFPVEIAIYRDLLPERIAKASPGFDLDEGLEDAIRRRGLRAQLRSGNLLTGKKFVAIDFFKNPAPVGEEPLRVAGRQVIPTEPASLEVLQDTVARIAKNIEKIPFEALAGDLRRTLQQIQRTLAGTDQLLGRVESDVAPELVAALAEAKKSMKNAGDMLAAESPVQIDLRQALVELRRTAESLRGLTDYLQRHPESLLRGKGEEPPLEPSEPQAERRRAP